MLRDYENLDDVNKQLERMGFDMGVRLIEDFLSRTASPRCLDMRDTAEKIQQAFRMYLSIQPTISNWAAAGDEFSLVFDTNPLAEFVELPPDLTQLRYSGLLCGCIRGALEMVQLEVQCAFVQVSGSMCITKQCLCKSSYFNAGWFNNVCLQELNCVFVFVLFYSYYCQQDQLKGDGVTEIRVKFIRRLEDAIPAGED